MNEIKTLTPTITNRLTRRCGLQESLQLHPYCRDFEIRAIECYESYGLSSNKCHDYIEDLRECVHGYKGHLRVCAMTKERQMQYEEGTRKDLFAPPPPEDAH